jgi:hypothetical protein
VVLSRLWQTNATGSALLRESGPGETRRSERSVQRMCRRTTTALSDVGVMFGSVRRGEKKEGKQRGMTGARGRGSLESAYKLVATHRATSAGLRIRVRVRLGFVLAAPSPVCIVHVEHGASDQIGMVMGRQTHDVRHEDSRTGAVAGSSGRQGEWTASPEEQRARILRRKPESDASEMLVCNAELEPEVELDNAATITPLGDENVAAHGGSGSAEHVAVRSRTKTHSDRLSTRRLF